MGGKQVRVDQQLLAGAHVVDAADAACAAPKLADTLGWENVGCPFQGFIVAIGSQVDTADEILVIVQNEKPVNEHVISLVVGIS
jgi:hypothetical protein